MEQKSNDSLMSSVVSVCLGAVAYISGRVLPIIPEDLSLFSKAKSNNFSGGLLHGIGNIRNLSAIAAGLITATATQSIINKHKNTILCKNNNENDPQTLHVDRLENKGIDAPISR
jgi:hypothetical protein